MPQLAIDGNEERILALLAIIYGKAVGPDVLGNIRRSSLEWRRGEPCLAQIHLAHSGLPALADPEEGSFRLSLGEKALADGAAPRELMKACGLDTAPLDLIKAGSNPGEARVHAGNGRGSVE